MLKLSTSWIIFTIIFLMITKIRLVRRKIAPSFNPTGTEVKRSFCNELDDDAIAGFDRYDLI